MMLAKCIKPIQRFQNLSEINALHKTPKETNKIQ